jgi:hypothetical protein
MEKHHRQSFDLPAPVITRNDPSSAPVVARNLADYSLHLDLHSWQMLPENMRRKEHEHHGEKPDRDIPQDTRPLPHPALSLDLQARH